MNNVLNTSGISSRARTNTENRKSRRRRTSALAVLSAAAAAAALLPGTRTRADIYYYRGPNVGNWDSSSNAYFSWFDSTTPGLVDFPPNGGDANFYQSGTNGVAGFSVIYNHIYSGAGLNTMSIVSGNTLLQSQASSVMIAGTEYVGLNATGTYTQSAGTNKVTGGMYLGFNGAGVGKLALSGGTLSVGSQEYIGYFGNGTFDQTGGSNSANILTMGWQASGKGTTTLSDGTITTGATYVGWLGN